MSLGFKGIVFNFLTSQNKACHFQVRGAKLLETHTADCTSKSADEAVCLGEVTKKAYLPKSKFQQDHTVIQILASKLGVKRHGRR